MNYLATVSFDIYDADSEAREAIYQSLRQVGLYQRIEDLPGSPGDTLPETTVAGTFEAANAPALRDDLMLHVKTLINVHGFRSKIFIGVGGTDWAWMQGHA